MRLTSLCAIAVAILSLGCASTARYVVAQPAIQSFALTDAGLPAAFKGRIVMKCTLQDKDGTCIYASVFYDHAATFATVTKDERNALAYVLLSTADDNCSWFLNRVFANRSGVTGIRDGIKNLLTGAAALTAKPSPAISAGLGFANLFADSTVKSLDANEFASKTFDVIESAIKAERNKTETEIMLKLDAGVDKYPVGALLLDVGRLKDQCTLPAGIRGLQTTATTQEQTTETARKTAATTLTGVAIQ